MPAEGLARSWCGRESSLCALVCVGVLSLRPRARAGSSCHGPRLREACGLAPGSGSASERGAGWAPRNAINLPGRRADPPSLRGHLPPREAVNPGRGSLSPQDQACAAAASGIPQSRHACSCRGMSPSPVPARQPPPSPSRLCSLAGHVPATDPSVRRLASPTEEGEDFRVLPGVNPGSEFAGGSACGS